MRFRLYLDEVGNSDLKGAVDDPNIQYLSLTGIIAAADTHSQIIQPAVDDLKMQHFGHAPGNPVILHRKEIVKREGSFAILNDAQKRRNFDDALLDLFTTLPYRVITVVIDKKEHLQKYSTWRFDPYHYCFRCLIERYVMWMHRHNFTGDVMAEARFKKADKRLKASYQSMWQNGTDHISAKIIQTRLTSKEIKLSPKAENIAAIQLCDLIAHPSFRWMLHEKKGSVPPDDFGSKVIKSCTKKSINVIQKLW